MNIDVLVSTIHRLDVAFFKGSELSIFCATLQIGERHMGLDPLG